jgi:hypothetical protein
MKIPLQHADQRHLENARGEAGEQSKRIHHNVRIEIPYHVDMKSRRRPHKFLASKRSPKHFLHIPGRAGMREVGRRIGHCT